LREQSRAFLGAFRSALQKADIDNFAGDAWTPVRQLLNELSRSRALGGFSSSETATFIFSLKKPLFARLRAEFKSDAEALADVLIDCVEGGASVSFMLPLPRESRGISLLRAKVRRCGLPRECAAKTKGQSPMPQPVSSAHKLSQVHPSLAIIAPFSAKDIET